MDQSGSTAADEVVIVKLGGSLITDKRRIDAARTDTIDRLAGELARAAPVLGAKLVIGHGSGSFGHAAAARFRLHEGLRSPDQMRGVSITQGRAARLHRLVVDAVERTQLNPFSISPSSAMLASGGRPVQVRSEPLLMAIGMGLVPIVYGDVVLDRRRGISICSTETVLLALARHLLRRRIRIRRVLWAGETDGVLDTAGGTIPRISPRDLARLRPSIGAPDGTDVTGGMRHRLETAVALARLGIPSWILNGHRPGVLERALAGECPAASRVVADGAGR